MHPDSANTGAPSVGGAKSDEGLYELLSILTAAQEFALRPPWRAGDLRLSQAGAYLEPFSAYLSEVGRPDLAEDLSEDGFWEFLCANFPTAGQTEDEGMCVRNLFLMEALLCSTLVQKVLYSSENGGLRDGYVFFYNPLEPVPYVQLHHLPRRRMTLVLPPYDGEFDSYRHGLRLLLERKVSGTGTDWDNNHSFKEYFTEDKFWPSIKRNQQDRQDKETAQHAFPRGLQALCKYSNLGRASVSCAQAPRDRFCNTVDAVWNAAVDGVGAPTAHTKEGYLHQLTARRLLDEYVIQRRRLLRSVQSARHAGTPCPNRQLEDVPFIREVNFDYERCPAVGRSNRILLVEEEELFLGNVLQRCADLYWRPIFESKDGRPTVDEETASPCFLRWEPRPASATWKKMEQWESAEGESCPAEVREFLGDLKLLTRDAKRNVTDALTNCTHRMLDWLGNLIASKDESDPRFKQRKGLLLDNPPGPFPTGDDHCDEIDTERFYGLGLSEGTVEEELAKCCRRLLADETGEEPRETERFLAKLLRLLVSGQGRPYTDDQLAQILRVDPFVMQVQLAHYEEQVNAGTAQENTVRFFCSAPIDPVNFFEWEKPHRKDEKRPDRPHREKKDDLFGIWVGFIEQPREKERTPSKRFGYSMLYAPDAEERKEAERLFRGRMHRLRAILNTIFQPTVREYTESKLKAAKEDALSEKENAERHARKATASAMKSALAAIMARNMSHNLGSHALYHFEEIHREVWNSPPADGDGVAQDTRRGRCQARGPIEVPGPQSADELRYKELERLRKLFMRHLQARMDFVAQAVTTVPQYSEGGLLGEAISEFRENVFLRRGLVKSSGSVFDVSCPEPDIAEGVGLVAWPWGNLGKQAFLALLEGIARNSVKHGIRPGSTKKKIALCISASPGPTDEYVQVEISDDLQSWTDEVERKLSRGMKAPFLDDDTGEIAGEFWGLKELRICAAFLRRLGPLSASANKPGARNETTCQRVLTQPGGAKDLLVPFNASGSVGYRLLLRRYKLVLYVVKDGPPVDGRYHDVVPVDKLDALVGGTEYMIAAYETGTDKEAARVLPIRRVPLFATGEPMLAADASVDAVVQQVKDLYLRWLDRRFGAARLGLPDKIVYVPDCCPSASENWAGLEVDGFAIEVNVPEDDCDGTFILAGHLNAPYEQETHGYQRVSQDEPVLRASLNDPASGFFLPRTRALDVLSAELFVLGLREAAASTILIVDERLCGQCREHQDGGVFYWQYLEEGQHITLADLDSTDGQHVLFGGFQWMAPEELRKLLTVNQSQTGDAMTASFHGPNAENNLPGTCRRTLWNFACFHLSLLEQACDPFPDREDGKLWVDLLIDALVSARDDGWFDHLVIHTGRGKGITGERGRKLSQDGVMQMSFAALDHAFRQGKPALCKALHSLLP